METNKIYQALEDDFTSTFIHELLPGMLHNFANPLNGIMGRSKLLQRRIDDVVKKIYEKYPETAGDLQEEFKRIKNDTYSVNSEAESFFEIFRDATGKFYALAAKGEDRINISHLLAAEMRFANFYLEFKHEINKNVQFDNDVPDFKGNVSDFSLVFWRLIRFAMARSLSSEHKEFILETRHDDQNIIVFIKYSGEAVPEDDGNIVKNYLQNNTTDLMTVKMERGVLLALVILKKYSARVQFSAEDELNVISVTIPHRFPAG
jgi:nitrogen-specific signal transduction histidine kinase